MTQDILDRAPLGSEGTRIQRLIRAELPRLLQQDLIQQFGAFGLGIGRKEAGGPVALRIYVECKLPLDLLPTSRRVPPTVRIKDGLDNWMDVPTDVVVRPPPRLAMEDPEDRLRPVPGGSSISIPGSGGNGTLGGYVLDKTDETVVALTNRHVSGGVIGAPVIQPGEVDGGNLPGDRIGNVKRVVNFVLPGNQPNFFTWNFVDAAIIGLDDPDLIDLTTIEIGPGIYETALPEVGDPVQKTGQTTGYQTGTVVDADFSFFLNVPTSPGNERRVIFCDCFIIDETLGTPLPGFASDGDSGAVIFGFAEEPDAVIHPALGLLFGSTGGGGAYACKMSYVFDLLDLDVLCASGYPAYLDGLAAGDDEDTAPRFTSRERQVRAPRRATAGLARDVEARLRESNEGQTISNLLRRFRAPIFARLIRQGEARRALTAALSPVLRGARTSDDVLGYIITEQDLKRIKSVIAVFQREDLQELAEAIAQLALAKESACGKTVGEILRLQ